YDLSKSPIVCPKCGTVFEVVAPPVRARAEAAPRTAAKPAPVVMAPETADAEFISLEDADAETAGAKVADGAEGEDEDVEVGETLDAFIEEGEEGDADVTDIIGDGIEKEEET
ncbi:MAG: TIGR02300 family protein, partial [Hyphomicrobiaceae bacterium]